jgi:WD40 repeat protein
MTYPEAIPCPSRCFTASKDGKVLFCCGMWNDDVQARLLSNCKKVDQIEHRDLVTSIVLTEDGKFLLSASKDCTIMIWNINTAQNLQMASTFSSLLGLTKQQKSKQIFSVKSILYGHTDTITTIDASSDLDMVVSGSKDKSIMIYTLRSGKYVRSLEHNFAITQLKLSVNGNFVAYSDEKSLLLLYSINGRLLSKKKCILKRVLAMTFSSDGRYFLSAGVGNYIVVRDVPSFNIVYLFEAPQTVFSLEFVHSLEQSFLIASMVNSSLRVYPFDPAHFPNQ